MLNAGIVAIVVTRPAVLALLALTAVLAWPLERLLGRGHPGLAFVVIFGAVLAATTTTAQQPHFSLDGVRVYLEAWTGNPLTGFAGTAEKWANIGLFLPLGAMARWLWRRPAVIVAAGATLSFLIEGWQGFLGRGGDPVDVVHNTVGTLAGVALATALRRVRPAPSVVDAAQDRAHGQLGEVEEFTTGDREGR